MDICCGTCQARWTGLTRAHCSGCHLTFNSVSAFDHHRVRFNCDDPASRGLIESTGIWRSPMDEDAPVRKKAAA